jgi:hypothetical protein
VGYGQGYGFGVRRLVLATLLAKEYRRSRFESLSEVRVAAGYLGSARTWSAFEKQWQLALKEAHVGEFHATDFSAARGEFTGWTAARQIKYSKRYCAIAEKHTAVGFATGVEVEPSSECSRPN